MYPVNLTNSYFPGQADDEVRPTTVGGILSDAARAMPNSPALVEAHADGSMGRAWTYEELLAAAMRQAASLLQDLPPASGSRSGRQTHPNGQSSNLRRRWRG
jgi:acyl-CoA synthetase (AMP-forming)/AMP-acid ligase II